MYLLRLCIPRMSVLLDLALLPNTEVFGCAAVPTTPSQSGNNGPLQEDPGPDSQEGTIAGCMVASLKEAYYRFVTFL